jgi:hypothetical protein
MNKHQLRNYMEAVRVLDYATHSMLLDIYNDTEEIPDDIVNLICHPRETHNPFVLMGGQETLEKLNEACEKYIQSLKQTEDEKKPYHSSGRKPYTRMA